MFVVVCKADMESNSILYDNSNKKQVLNRLEFFVMTFIDFFVILKLFYISILIAFVYFACFSATDDEASASPSLFTLTKSHRVAISSGLVLHKCPATP